jgi:hypothetical protein
VGCSCGGGKEVLKRTYVGRFAGLTRKWRCEVPASLLQTRASGRSLLAYWRGSRGGGGGGAGGARRGRFMHFDSCAAANGPAAAATAAVLWKALHVRGGGQGGSEGSNEGDGDGGRSCSMSVPPAPAVESTAAWMPRQCNGVRADSPTTRGVVGGANGGRP